MKAEAGAAPRFLFTSLLASPRMCGWIFGAGALHLALAATPLGGWSCPFLAATGWPCPGCGLGRAAVLLLRGHVRESIHLHAFAGPLLLALAVLGAGLLPGRAGAATRAAVQSVEQRTWIVPAMLAGLIIYWLARFTLDAAAFHTLVV